jgi:hypothetical protein
LETRFLQQKVGSYILPVDPDLETQQREELQYYSLKLCIACNRVYPPFRAAALEIVLPEHLVTIVSQPGSDDRVVALAFKLLAEDSEPLADRSWVSGLVCNCRGLAEGIARALESGTYRTRLACVEFCRTLFDTCADPRQIRFLASEDFVKACMDFVDLDAPALALAAIDALVSLLSRYESASYGLNLPFLAVVLNQDEFTDQLEEMGGEPNRLSRRAVELLRVISEWVPRDGVLPVEPAAEELEIEVVEVDQPEPEGPFVIMQPPPGLMFGDPIAPWQFDGRDHEARSFAVAFEG